MKIPQRILVAVALGIGTATVAACSSGPVISPKTIGSSDKLCTDAGAFQTQADSLEAAANASDLTAEKADITATTAAVNTLVTDAAKLPDKVNGHLVKDDLGVVLSTYQSLEKAVAGVDPSNQVAFANALAGVQSGEGDALTTASGRLDAYTKSVCHLVVSNPTTTAASAAPTTTIAATGPTVAPTTSSSSTTTSSTTASSTTTAP